MQAQAIIPTAVFLASALMWGCGGGNSGTNLGGSGETPPAAPAISSTAAQNGAVIVTLTGTAGLVINYTVDGSTPTPASPQYQAPFLVASNLTVKAIAVGGAPVLMISTVTSQGFSPNIPSGMLVWSDEFTNTSGAQAQPDPTVWTYDKGTDCCGNNELEDYCAWDSSVSPCNPATPSEYVGTDGSLHIVAQQPSPGVYTSARLKTQGLFSFQYGRLEVKAMVPEAQGFWPAAWLLRHQHPQRRLASLRGTGRAGARQRGRIAGLE